MTALDQRLQAQLADLLDRLAALETQVRSIPSRTLTNDGQNLVLEVTQAGHGFFPGDVVRHNGTTWVIASANDVTADEKLGIVGLVLNSTAFLVVLAGSMCLAGLADWTTYYLGASGDLVTTPPAAPAIRRAVVLHTQGQVCHLIGPHLATAHGHRLTDLRDVDLTGLADGQGLIWDATNARWEPGVSLPTDPGGTVPANRVLAGPATGAAAAPTFRGLTAADLPAIGANVATDTTDTTPGPVLDFSAAAGPGSIGTIRIKTKIATYNARWLMGYDINDGAIAASGWLGCQMMYFSNSSDEITFSAKIGAGTNGTNGSLLVAYTTGPTTFEVGEVDPVANGATGYVLGVDTDLSGANTKPKWLRDITLGQGPGSTGSTPGKLTLVNGTDGDYIVLNPAPGVYLRAFDRSLSTTTPVVEIKNSPFGAELSMYAPGLMGDPFLVINANDVAPSGGWNSTKTLRLRQIEECDTAGNPVYRLQLASNQFA